MNDRASWTRLLLIAALLVVFALTGRGGAGRLQTGDSFDAQCELNPPHDVIVLERCLALHPRDLEVMLDLGSMYEADSRLDRAEALYRRALSIDPKDGDVHVRLGRLLLQRGDPTAAVREGHLALALQPRSARALDLLARAGHGGVE